MIDMLLFMSVCSGAGGQSYHNEVTAKIREARQKYKNLTIQVDGGVNKSTIDIVVNAGATNLVIGSYITEAENLAKRIKEIKTAIEQPT